LSLKNQSRPEAGLHDVAGRTLPPESIEAMIAIELLFVFLLIFANGFFVAAEFALVKVRLSRIDVLAAEGRWSAKITRRLIEHLDAYLSACQLGITLASLGLGWVGEPFVASLLAPAMRWLGLSEETAHIVALPVAFAAITFLHITVGEVAPKSMAIRKATGTSLVVAPPLMAFYYIFRPFIRLLNASSNLLLKMVGLGAVSDSEMVHSEEEVRLILSESARGGSLSVGERLLMENVLDLEEKTARQVMLPRGEIVYLSTDDSVAENYHTIARSGHTRFPLCDGDLDRVVGVIHAKAVLRALIEKQPIESLTELSKRAPFVPETVRLDKLLREFLATRSHLAMVVDEFGSITGMVTFEDVLEQLVGPIQDEFDRELPPVIKRGDGRFLVDGGCPVDVLAAECQLVLPEAQATTAGGLVSELLGRIPDDGDRLCIGRHEVTVLEATPKRVHRLEVVRCADECGPVEQATSLELERQHARGGQ
jgi:CBS domain containing-hemolysin-like protein